MGGTRDGKTSTLAGFDTLAEVNANFKDGTTLDDSADPRDPKAHNQLLATITDARNAARRDVGTGAGDVAQGDAPAAAQAAAEATAAADATAKANAAAAASDPAGSAAAAQAASEPVGTVATHAAIAGAHHARYTDGEADSRVAAGTSADTAAVSGTAAATVASGAAAGATALQPPSGKWAVQGGRLVYDGSRWLTGITDDLKDSDLDTDIWTEATAGTEPTVHAEGADGYAVTTASGSSSEASISTPLRSTSGVVVAYLGVDDATNDYGVGLALEMDSTRSHFIQVIRESGNYACRAGRNNGGSYTWYTSSTGVQAGWVAIVFSETELVMWRNTSPAGTSVPTTGWALMTASPVALTLWPHILPTSGGYPRVRLYVANWGAFPAATARAKHLRYLP